MRACWSSTLLGASRVVGAVRSSKLEAVSRTRLPYDQLVDSQNLVTALANEKFDVIIDPVGGALRKQSFAVMKPGSRLIAVGNASGDWASEVKTNDLWLGSVTVAGFNAGAYLPSHGEAVRAGLDAGLRAVAAGLLDTPIDLLSFAEASLAHARMESRALDGRIVLTPT
ncbi:zinc-binding dehydrogenase [Rhodobacter sp. 24-YEA-8]|uniref:zinc-binding dehydrogenase n=1 Tax=Rhodobacter sp. 24-YEA-8 TaxID=1884310 RepID=UPI00344F337A